MLKGKRNYYSWVGFDIFVSVLVLSVFLAASKTRERKEKKRRRIE